MENVTALALPPRSLDIASLPQDELADEVQEFVQDELRRLNDQISALEARAAKIEAVKLDDPRLIRRIKAEKEALTVERLYPLWLEVTKPERDADERAFVLRRKAVDRSESLRYFTVTNARSNTIHVLAEDATVARFIAYMADRITDPSHGRVRSFDSAALDALQCKDALREALAAGWPGQIEIMGTKVVHRSRKEVFG